MLQVSKEYIDSLLVVRLSGIIEENADFDLQIGPVNGELRVVCKEVVRINSAGVRTWILYFGGLSKQGVKLTFTECSPPIVEQLNLIRNFNANGAIESIYVPYRCIDCLKSYVALFKTEKLQRVRNNLPLPTCAKCGAKTAFDDLAKEYFNFLDREG